MGNKMSESQSRYSIVERLTQRKLEIISEKLELDEELKIKQQEVIAKTMNNIIVVNEVVQDLNKDQKPKSESQPNIPKKATSITQSTSFHVGDSIIVSFD